MMDHFNDMRQNLNDDIDVNQKNQDVYNHILEHSRDKRNGYWDRNDPIIKIVLLVLLIIALLGTIYYFIIWLNVK